jgi:hypothetical protein
MPWPFHPSGVVGSRFPQRQPWQRCDGPLNSLVKTQIQNKVSQLAKSDVFVRKTAQYFLQKPSVHCACSGNCQAQVVAADDRFGPVLSLVPNNLSVNYSSYPITGKDGDKTAPQFQGRSAGLSGYCAWG